MKSFNRSGTVIYGMMISISLMKVHCLACLQVNADGSEGVDVDEFEIWRVAGHLDGPESLPLPLPLSICHAKLQLLVAYLFLISLQNLIIYVLG